jgi:[acyl-carrier-protein] S-malonyltransferase
MQKLTKQEYLSIVLCMKDNIICLFPGQGAQYSGMCKDLYKNYACVRRVFEAVSSYSHTNMANMCFESSSKELIRPDKASLTTFTASMSMVEIIKDYFQCDLNNIFDFAVGHSMGQYSALCAVGSVSFKDAVVLLQERSIHSMQISGNNHGMICVVGLNREKIECLIRSVQDKGGAYVANYNLHDQFVISGKNIALDSLLENAKKAGAKIAKKLAISIPAHCKLMASTQGPMRDSLKKVKIVPPKMPLFSNETADVIMEPDQIKDFLVSQMCNGVNWVGIMEKFPRYNIVRSVELGPGKVLSGLVKRANVGCSVQPTGNVENIKLVIKQLERLLQR